MKKLKKVFISFIFIFVTFFCFNFKVEAKEVNVYMFYGKTCPHCEEALEYLNSIKEKYDLNIIKYEVWYNSDNRALMDDIAKSLDVNPTGVPFVIIDNTPIFGYSKDVTNSTYRYHIKLASKDNFVDKVGVKLGLIDGEELKKLDKNNKDSSYKINLPLIGEVSFKNKSLFTSTFILALIDVINPNVLWIIFLLFGLLICVKDNKKFWILGLTFIVSLALTYLPFLLSWINFEDMISFSILIRVIMSLFIIIYATFRLNSFANMLDNTNVDKSEHKTFNKALYIFIIIGMCILGLSCTLINFSYFNELPSLLTEILTIKSASGLQYFGYSFLYIMIIIIIKIIILFILYKIAKLFKKHINNKYLYLISGILVLLIGIILILKPEILMFDF